MTGVSEGRTGGSVRMLPLGIRLEAVHVVPAIRGGLRLSWSGAGVDGLGAEY